MSEENKFLFPIEEVAKCEYGDKDGICRMYEDTPHKCIALFGIRCDDSMPPNWWEKKKKAKK